jgi:hypothetical protein
MKMGEEGSKLGAQLHQWMEMFLAVLNTSLERLMSY